MTSARRSTVIEVNAPWIGRHAPGCARAHPRPAVSW
jgi:hypothetical protein